MYFIIVRVCLSDDRSWMCNERKTLTANDGHLDWPSFSTLFVHRVYTKQAYPNNIMSTTFSTTTNQQIKKHTLMERRLSNRHLYLRLLRARPDMHHTNTYLHNPEYTHLTNLSRVTSWVSHTIIYTNLQRFLRDGPESVISVAFSGNVLYRPVLCATPRPQHVVGIWLYRRPVHMDDVWCLFPLCKQKVATERLVNERKHPNKRNATDVINPRGMYFNIYIYMSA